MGNGPLTDSDRDPQAVINANRPAVSTNADGVVSRAANPGAYPKDATADAYSNGGVLGSGGALGAPAGFIAKTFSGGENAPAPGPYGGRDSNYTGGADAPTYTVGSGMSEARKQPESASGNAGTGSTDRTGSPGQADQDTASNQVATAKPIDPTDGPVSAAVAGNQPGMTTEQANAYYGAQRAGMQAQDAQRAQVAQNVAGAQANAAQTSWDQQQANQRALVAENSAGGRGNPRLAREARSRADQAGVVARAAQGGLTDAQSGKGVINPVQDAVTQQDQMRKAALQPGEQGLQQAVIGEKQAYTKHLGQSGGLIDAQTAAEQQKTAGAATQQHMQAIMADLHAKAAAGDKQSLDLLSEYTNAMNGKGEFTPALRAHAMSSIMDKMATMGQTMTPEQFTQHMGYMDQLSGKSAPHPMEGATVMGKAGTPYAGKQGKIVNGNFVPDKA